MKNSLFFLSVFVVFTLPVVSQKVPKLDDFGRIVLNTYVSDKMNLPAEAKNLLETKLSQIASNYGMGGSSSNPRFIITADINVGSKDIIPGPPQMIAQNFNVILFIGDAIENKSFCNTTLSIKGVGTNENKAYIYALKNINPKNNEIEKFIEEGKTKIISYYLTQCDFIIKDVHTLVMQEKYDEAIYKLCQVPETCKDCFFKCMDTLAVVYQKKIDMDCKNKLTQAKTVWAASQNPDGAVKVGDIISQIKPNANCQAEVKAFMNSIDSKLAADDKKNWDFTMKQYNDNIEKEKRNEEIEKFRINAYRDIAIEYFRNQPKTITNNNIYWK